jgi:hypothetical protein
MRAVVTKDFKGKDNHSPRCIQYVKGQVIDDPIASSAVKAGDAEPLGGEVEQPQGELAAGKAPPENKVVAPPENKTTDGQAAGQAPPARRRG